MSDEELLELAPLVGLNALDDAELAEVHRLVDAAPPHVRADFESAVRGTREAMATVSASTAVHPPSTLRDRIMSTALGESALGESALDGPALDGPAPDEPSGAGTTTPAQPMPSATVTSLSDHPRRRRLSYLAAAAVAAIAIGALGWVIGVRSQESTPTQTNTAQQVFTADDVRTSSGDVATGHATVTFSESANAGVLVMNDVPPPAPGTVYQMWLTGPDGATSAGTMTDKDVAPSTTAVITGIDNAQSLAFTVEPPGGSQQPTTAFVAELPLQ